MTRHRKRRAEENRGSATRDRGEARMRWYIVASSEGEAGRSVRNSMLDAPRTKAFDEVHQGERHAFRTRAFQGIRPVQVPCSVRGSNVLSCPVHSGAAGRAMFSKAGERNASACPRWYRKSEQGGEFDYSRRPGCAARILPRW